MFPVNNPLDVSYPYNGTFNKGTSSELFYEKSRAFNNINENFYAAEKLLADANKVPRGIKGSSEFEQILNSKVSIKWTYTIYRELYIVPEMWLGREVPHSIAAGGKKVFTAGFGDWKGDVLELNNWTGHYKVSKDSLGLHLHDAWGDSGVNYRPQ